MNGPPERYEFWNLISSMGGWLEQGAAIRTMDMLEFQEMHSIPGPLLEIGVFKGKYFSILLRSAIKTDDNILGIDVFELVSIESVQQTFAATPLTHENQLTFWKRSSNNCTAWEIETHLGGRPRFISVDGSHEAPDVLWDLQLAEQLVGDGGVVAVDDFLNPVTMGVTEAVFMFFAKPRRFIPFAYIENKLFLAARRWAPRYRDMLEDKAMKDDVEGHSAEFRRLLGIDRNLVDQRLWGAPVLLLRRL